MTSEKFREDNDFYFISKQGMESFEYFNIIYTIFSKMKDPTPKDIIENFQERILSKNEAGIRRYIEDICKKDWPKYNFEWEQDSYQSNEIDGKNIYVLIDKSPQRKMSIDAIIIKKEK